MTKIFQIAIDGPGGAGKSTIAKILAKKLGIDYIDTGAMYRAIGYKMINNNIDLTEINKVKEILDNTKIDFDKGKIYLDDKDVSEYIRTPQMSIMASKVSSIFEVREKLVALQRRMGKTKSIVMDGRDIGTNVLKDAEFKFFMTASAKERAKRRYDELLAKGENITFDSVLKDIEDRDFNDMNRKLNPLVKADDAILIDTSGMGIEEVVDAILTEVVKNGDIKTV